MISYIDLPFGSKDSGNLCILKLDKQGKLVDQQLHQNLFKEGIRGHFITQFNNQDYAIATSPSKDFKLVSLKKNESDKSIELQTSMVKRVKKIIQNNGDIYELDKNGDIYKLVLEDNKVKLQYVTQNLAIPSYFGTVFGYYILGDTYHKIKLYNGQDLLDLENVWVPFNRSNLKVVSENNDNALLGFKVYEYLNTNNNKRSIGGQQQEQQEQQQQQQDDNLEKDDGLLEKERKQSEKSGKNWFEFYQISKNDLLVDSEFRGEKVFQLDNVRKIRYLELNDKQLLLAGLFYENLEDEKLQLRLQILDLEKYQIVQEFQQEQQMQVLREFYDNREHKFRLYLTGQDRFGIYIHKKQSDIENKEFKAQQIDNDIIKFNENNEELFTLSDMI